MKKLLMVLTVVGFVACNNSADSTTATDTTAVKVDTAASHMDTAAAHMDTAAAHMDTTAKKDTSKK